MTPSDLMSVVTIAKEMVEKEPTHELHAVYMMLAALLKHEADKGNENDLSGSWLARRSDPRDEEPRS